MSAFKVNWRKFIQPYEFLHEGAAVVGSMWAAMTIKHGEVQQVVMDTGDTESVLILLPETQNRRTADPRQADLRGRQILTFNYLNTPTKLFLLSLCFVPLS